MPNIIQAEFFHVGRGAESLDQVIGECAERVLDGSPIKTGVRFYDTQGDLTSKILKYASLDNWCGELEKKIPDASGLWRAVLVRAHRHYFKKYLKVKKSFLLLAIERVKMAALTSEEIALEQFDHSFKEMPSDEMHEVLERIEKAKGVWIFLFKPNDLLSDTQASISAVM